MVLSGCDVLGLLFGAAFFLSVIGQPSPWPMSHCSIAAMSYRTIAPHFSGCGNPSRCLQRCRVMPDIWKCSAVCFGRVRVAGTAWAELVAISSASLWASVSDGYLFNTSENGCAGAAYPIKSNWLADSPPDGLILLIRLCDLRVKVT